MNLILNDENYPKYSWASAYLQSDVNRELSLQLTQAKAYLYQYTGGISYWFSPHGSVDERIVFLSELADPHLILCYPLPVSLYSWPSGFTACFDELDEFAVGDDQSSALDELRSMIAESYRILKSEKDNLGPLQQRHWNLLSKIVREL